MKKILLTTLLTLASFGAAQTVDCSTLKMPLIDNLSYKEPATFPNPSKSVNKFLDSEKVDFNACGLSVTSDGNGNYTVKAGSREALVKLFTSGNTGIKRISFPFVGISGYKYPTIREGFFSYNVWFTYNFDTGAIGTFDYDAEDKASISTFRSASAGYKVNGGPITPFYYEGNITKATLPSTINTLDFYAMRGGYSKGMDRVLINLKEGSYQVWKSHPFPSN